MKKNKDLDRVELRDHKNRIKCWLEVNEESRLVCGFPGFAGKKNYVVIDEESVNRLREWLIGDVGELKSPESSVPMPEVVPKIGEVEEPIPIPPKPTIPEVPIPKEKVKEEIVNALNYVANKIMDL